MKICRQIDKNEIKIMFFLLFHRKKEQKKKKLPRTKFVERHRKIYCTYWVIFQILYICSPLFLYNLLFFDLIFFQRLVTRPRYGCANEIHKEHSQFWHTQSTVHIITYTHTQTRTDTYTVYTHSYCASQFL